MKIQAKDHASEYASWRQCSRFLVQETGQRKPSDNQWGFYTLIARPVILAHYRQRVGQSSKRRLGIVTKTSIGLTARPSHNVLLETAKELEKLSSINVLSITAGFNRVTAHYKTRRFRWVFAITM